MKRQPVAFDFYEMLLVALLLWILVLFAAHVGLY